MPEEPVFRTKTGFCHILPDRIVLTRDGVVGSAAQAVSSSLPRLLAIYGLLALALFYMSYDSYRTGSAWQAGFLSLLGLSLAYGILTSLNNSATPVIERSRIRRVRFHPSRPGITRTYFAVFFADENGRDKKRLIMLPGTLAGGKEETAKALQIMRAAKLLP